MEDTKDSSNNPSVAADSRKKNRIQVSSAKKPFFYYVNQAKKHIQQHGEVELSALGTAIATAVTIAEILKNNGFANEKKITTSTVNVKDTSTVNVKDESKGRSAQKARIEILLGRTEKFDELMAAGAGKKDEGDNAEEDEGDNAEEDLGENVVEDEGDVEEK